MALNRTFSFNDDDERALSSVEHDRLTYQHANDYSHPTYHDSPSRDMVSPPPQYFSPPPREPVSPASPSPPPRQYHPSAHPDSSFHQRQTPSDMSRKALPQPTESTESSRPPRPPPHRRRPSGEPAHDGRYWGQEIGYSHLQQGNLSVTPGTDNFGERTEGGGLSNVAMGVADRNQRESGLQALHAMEHSRPQQGSFPRERDHDSRGLDAGYMPHRGDPSDPRLRQRDSYSSNIPLAAGAVTPGSITPGATPDLRSSGMSGRSIPLDDYPSTHHLPGPVMYQDSPYQTSSFNLHPQVNDANINPYNIADDGDDGFIPDPKRRTMLNMARQPSPERGQGPAGRAATSGGLMGALGGLMGRKRKAQTSSGSYDPVRPIASGNSVNAGSGGAEKSEWLSRQTKGNNKMRWVVGFAIGTVVVLAIIGGIIGGVLGTKNANSSAGSSNNDNTASGDTAANGDLGSNSAEIQALLNNPNLHKVFPGIDYTPWGTQYPLCLTYPPSQNNVTRDMAVLSQLTNAVRLYGTDCNQTEMVLHSIERLGLTEMKVWLGVWIDTNQTTIDRQLAQMYKILDGVKDKSIFKGAIIGNEALYRAGLDKASSEADLIQILTDVKANFTSNGWDIPVATSDLGDNWNGQLVDAVDMVMSNIHPFFAGVTANVASAWTINFWDTHDLVLTEGTSKKQIISETGWPSAGGTDCGGTTGDCTPGQSGAVAGIDEMNTFMDDFVCQALANGTDYFWFEAFDEPWKISYDTPGKDWEDKWGLMDSARNLKSGLNIPDCNGKTVS